MEKTYNEQWAEIQLTHMLAQARLEAAQDALAAFVTSAVAEPAHASPFQPRATLPALERAVEITAQR